MQSSTTKPNTNKLRILACMTVTLSIMSLVAESFIMPIILQGIIIGKHPEYDKEMLISTASFYKSFLDALVAATLFFGAPILGALSDIIGRKKILLSVLFMGVCDVVITGTAYYFNLLWLVYIGRFIGCFNSVVRDIGMAYMSDISLPSDKAKNFGFIMAGVSVGFVMAPGLTAYLSTFGVFPPLCLAIGCHFVNIMVTTIFIKESLHMDLYPHNSDTPLEITTTSTNTTTTNTTTNTTDIQSGEDGVNHHMGRMATLIHRRKIEFSDETWRALNPFNSLRILIDSSHRYTLLLCLIYMVYMVAGTDIASTFFLYTTYKYSWTSKEIGISFSSAGLVMTIYMAAILGPAVERYRERKVIMASLAVATIFVTCSAFASSGILFAVITSIACFGTVAASPMRAIITNELPETKQGAVILGLSSLSSFSTFFADLILENVFAYSINKSGTPGRGIYFPGLHLVVTGFLYLCALIGTIVLFRVYPAFTTKTPTSTSTVQSAKHIEHEALLSDEEERAGLPSL